MCYTLIGKICQYVVICMKKNSKLKRKMKITETEKILIMKSLLKITFIMICVSFVLKILGLDVFAADKSNKALILICNFIDKANLKVILDLIMLMLQSYIFLRLSCNNKNITVYYITAIIASVIALFSQYIIFSKLNLNNPSVETFIYFIFSFTFLILLTILIDIKIKNKEKNIIKKFFQKIKKPTLILITLTIYQIIVMFLRNITYNEAYDTLYNLLLNFDYIILLLATYYLFLNKETNVALSNSFDFTLPKMLNEKPDIENIRTSITNLNKKIKKFKKMKKTEKITIIIYVFLFILSELFNLAIIILVAYLNHAVIECLFILSSFLITKKIFGAFHFDSAIKCWIVSNLAFFFLNTITLNVGITFAVPILIGIGLSYFTSKFIKQINTTPYYGMPENDLLFICKSKNLNTLETNILNDFYCKRLNSNKISIKHNYSRATIFRIKSKALKKLEA